VKAEALSHDELMRQHLLNQMIQADQAGATNPQQMIMRLMEL
jgi:hypothetical protein